MAPRFLLAIWTAAFVASAGAGTHGLAYWDAADYVRLSLDGGTSGLLLGRPLFLWVSRGVAVLWLRVGVDPASIEPILRWMWAGASATAAPLLSVLAMRLGAARNAAIVSGFLLALSPSYAHTSHQVLTDGPALALSIGALIAALDRRTIAAAILIACAIATRETALVHAVAVAILLGRRRGTVAVAVAASILFAIVLLSHGGTFSSLAAWARSMQRSSTKHPLTLRDVALSLAFVVAVSPIGVLAGARALVRERPRGPLAIVVVPALIATLLLVFYPDGSFSPRYVLATAPIAFLIVAGPSLSTRPSLAALACAVPLSVVPIVTAKARTIALRGQTIAARVRTLPDRTLLVPGHVCPHARLALSIDRLRSGRTRDIELLCPGWDWPDDPLTVLEGARCTRPVAIDLDEEAWVGPREAVARDLVRKWAGASTGFVVLPARTCEGSGS